MRRENRFLISRKQFAIDLSTITGTQNPRGAQWSFSGSANAVWYRRKDGVTRACLGTMMLFSHTSPNRSTSTTRPQSCPQTSTAATAATVTPAGTANTTGDHKSPQNRHSTSPCSNRCWPTTP